MSTPEQAVALISAIRVFTVEAHNGRPNGKTEAALADLGMYLAVGNADPVRARLAFGRLAEALAADTKALRVAAEGYFGGDFRKPGDRV